MQTPQLKPYKLLPFILIIYFFAAWLQQQFVLNWDVSQLLHQANMLLNGGDYVTDFIMPNPPMILYLYALPLLLGTKLQINVTTTFPLFIFFIATVAFYLCCKLANKIFKSDEDFIQAIFLLATLSIFLIFPFYEFGQRDHLFTIMITPYLLLVTCRLTNQDNAFIRTLMPYIVGLLAGIGMVIKPQFLLVPLLIELYVLLVNRKFFSWVRTETMTISFIVVSYCLLLMHFFPNYTYIILPYLTKNYYTTISDPSKYLLAAPLPLYCLSLSIIIYLSHLRIAKLKHLSTILFLATLGSYFCYFLQGNRLFYHLIPLFSFSLLFITLYFFIVATEKSLSRLDACLALLPGIAAGLFLNFKMRNLWVLVIFDPIYYYSFFSLVFFIIYLAYKKSVLPSLGLVLLIMSFSLSCGYLIQNSHLITHYFIIMTTLLVLLFILTTIQDTHKKKVVILTPLLAICMFSYPAIISLELYNKGLEYKHSVLNNLISFMQTQPNYQAIYVLSERADYASPLIDYTTATLHQRFDCLWGIRGLVQYQKAHGEVATRAYIRDNKDALFFINVVTDDLQKYPPNLIFVDSRKNNTVYQAQPAYFDYIDYFSENKKFKNEWKSYRYLTTIEGKNWLASVFKLDVYKHI